MSEGLEPELPIDAPQLDLSSALLAAEIGAFGPEPSLPRLIRFGVVGSVGFLWDAGTTMLTRPVLGLTGALLLAFFVAATANWALNRIWTFRHAPHGASLLRQWALFLVANSFGFVLNRSAVFTLVAVFPFCRAWPALALAAGAGASLFANFILSQRYVFRLGRG